MSKLRVVDIVRKSHIGEHGKVCKHPAKAQGNGV